MWLSGDVIGPQKGPTSAGRLRAQWRQIDRENAEARLVRKQWMKLLGLADSEIREKADNAFDLSLEDELDQLSATIQLTHPRHK